MTLEEAFTSAIRKFYEGYDYEETSKHSPKMKEYSFSTLDSLHKELVPKRRPIEEMPEEEEFEDDV